MASQIKDSLKEYDWYKISKRHQKLRANQAKTTNNLDIEMAITKDIEAVKDTPSSSPSSCRSSSSQCRSFSNKQSLHLSLSLADTHLPKIPHKKAEVIKTLVEKYQVKFQIQKCARGRPRKDLKEEKRNWLIVFLAQSGITYTNPGQKDNVYIGKKDGKRYYKQRLYLLWNLRDLLGITNGTGKINVPNSFHQTFDKLLTFSQLYDFLKKHKEYYFNKSILHGSCLYEICENCLLLAKGLNKKLKDPQHAKSHNLFEKFACNLEAFECALNHCQGCCSNELYFSPKKMDPKETSETESTEAIGDEEMTYFSYTKIK